MFKINKQKNDGVLEIINIKTEEVVAQLRMDCDIKERKKLYVLDEAICTVISHSEAIKKLEAFFEGNRTQMLSNCIVIDELYRDLKNIKGGYAYKLISDDIMRLERHNRQLERFNELLYK